MQPTKVIKHYSVLAYFFHSRCLSCAGDSFDTKTYIWSFRRFFCLGPFHIDIKYKWCPSVSLHIQVTFVETKAEQKINKSTTAIDHVLPLVEPYGLQPNDLNRKSGRELRQNFLPSPCWSLSIILLKWWRRDKFQKGDILISFFTCTVRLRAFLKRFWSKTKLPILRFEIWGPVQNMLPFMNVCHLVCFQILFWLNFWP